MPICPRCKVRATDVSENGHYLNFDHAPHTGIPCNTETAQRYVPPPPGFQPDPCSDCDGQGCTLCDHTGWDL